MFLVCADAHGHRLYAVPSGRKADPWELDTRERAKTFASQDEAAVVAVAIGAHVVPALGDEPLVVAERGRA